MNSNAAVQKRYPVTQINSEQYVPMQVFGMMWTMNRLKGSESLSYLNQLNPSEKLISLVKSLSPLALMISMVILIMSASSLTRAASVAAAFSNPFLLVVMGIFGTSLYLVVKKVQTATNEKNAGDFAVLESARQYLQNRYETLPQNWEERFIGYLVEEKVPDNKFSTEYELKVRNFKGYDVLMIANVDGEAPLKNAAKEQ